MSYFLGVCGNPQIPMILLMEEILHHLGCIKHLSTGAGFLPSTVWIFFSNSKEQPTLISGWLGFYSHNSCNQLHIVVEVFTKWCKTHQFFFMLNVRFHDAAGFTMLWSKLSDSSGPINHVWYLFCFVTALFHGSQFCGWEHRSVYQVFYQDEFHSHSQKGM